MEFYANRGFCGRQGPLLCVRVQKSDLKTARGTGLEGESEEAGRKIEKGLSWEMNLTSNWGKYKLIFSQLRS